MTISQYMASRLLEAPKSGGFQQFLEQDCQEFEQKTFSQELNKHLHLSTNVSYSIV